MSLACGAPSLDFARRSAPAVLAPPLAAHQAQRKRGQTQLVIRQFRQRHHRLVGENVFGQIQAQLHSAQHDLRKQPGDQDSRQQAGQGHEQQIVAGVQRRERDHENSHHVDDAFARHAVVQAIGEKPQRRAPGQHRNDGEGHPCG